MKRRSDDDAGLPHGRAPADGAGKEAGAAGNATEHERRESLLRWLDEFLPKLVAAAEGAGTSRRQRPRAANCNRTLR